MRRARTVRIGAAAGVTAVAALGIALAVPGQAAPPSDSAQQSDRGTQRVEYFDGPESHPRQVEIPAAMPKRFSGSGSVAGDGDVTPIVENGGTGDKLDIAIIGDGYTEGELEQFHTDAKESWAALADVEPYTEYQKSFNVWAVDAVSQESGVSGDPDQGAVKKTALDSHFWCDNTERLLCVDTAKVESYAAKAPAADLVIVIANSSKYGGAGYSGVQNGVGYDGIATHSGGNEQAGQIAIHETGHSLGHLADEYAYEESEYTGEETGDVNTTVHTADELGQNGTKWAQWLGESTPDGGTIGAYEGAAYHTRGLYRPSEDSIMRTLGREFSVVGREAMIAGFHRHAPALTSETRTTKALGADDSVTVGVQERTGDAPKTDLRWYLDGKELKDLRGDRTVKLAAVVQDGGSHKLTAKATDPTDAVRSPALRKELTKSLSWNVEG
ncbi:M64 family metallopeptidase [Streptomyces sp. NPDC054784]